MTELLIDLHNPWVTWRKNIDIQQTFSAPSTSQYIDACTRMCYKRIQRTSPSHPAPTDSEIGFSGQVIRPFH